MLTGETGTMLWGKGVYMYMHAPHKSAVQLRVMLWVPADEQSKSPVPSKEG